MTAQIYDDANLARLAVDWMTHDVAGAAEAAHLEQILSATGRERPQSRWVALLQEPPMRIQSMVAVGTPARRPILILAGLGLLILAAVLVIVGAQLLQPRTAADDWPMYRNDPAHSGLGVAGPVGRPIVAWRHQGQMVTRNLSIVGDLVYAMTDDGVLHALGVADGVERWNVNISGAEGGSGPAVVDGVVYVLDGDGYVHALDAKTGTVKWKSKTAAVNPSNPTVAQGALIVGANDGTLVAFDLASGSERWRKPVGDLSSGKAPASDGTSVYVGGVGQFVSIDVATQAQRWSVPIGTDFIGTAIVAGGIAYVGNTPDSTTGSLRAIEAATGKVLWQTNEPMYTPAVANGVAYAANGSGIVEAIETATGKVLWRADYHVRARPPTIAGNVLYLPMEGENRLYALDPATGGELWRLDVDGPNQCCVAVSKGSLFIATTSGSVYRISGDGAALTPAPLVTAPPATATPAPTEVPSSAPAVAKFVSKAYGPGASFYPIAGMTLDPMGRIWVTDPGNGRFAIFDGNGAFVEYWGEPGSETGRFNLRRSNGDDYAGIAFAADGSFYVLDVGNHRVQKFSADRRFVQSWGSFGLGPGQFNDPVGIAVDKAGVVEVVDAVRGVLERYDSDGHVLGTLDVFSNTHHGFNAANGFRIDADGNIYVSQLVPDQLAKFSPTGELLALFGTTGPGKLHEAPGPVFVDGTGRVFMTQGPTRGSAPGVLVYASDGTYLGGFGPVGSEDASLAFPTGIVVIGDMVFVEDAGDTIPGKATGTLKAFRLLPPLAP